MDKTMTGKLYRKISLIRRVIFGQKLTVYLVPLNCKMDHQTSR